jgi:AcrR family transcriptional regulator
VKPPRPVGGLLSCDEDFDPLAEHILDAAYAEVAEHGLHQGLVDAVAARAGVSIVALRDIYRDRRGLLGALACREALGLIARADHKVATTIDPVERIVVGFLYLLEGMRAHPFAHLMALDSAEALHPVLTGAADLPLALVRAFLAHQIELARDQHARVRAETDQLAEVMARLALSFLLTPQTNLPLDDVARLAEMARTIVVPLVFEVDDTN